MKDENKKEFTENDLRKFVIKLRKKHRSIEDKRRFLNSHNFNLEAESKRNEADIVTSIIHEMESEFDLGFVWDNSLNE